MVLHRVRPVITVCAGLALVLSLFMWYHEYSFHTALPGCSGDSDCGAVANSRWAFWGPLPIAALGVGCYVSLIIAAWMVEYQHCTHCHTIWSFMAIQSIIGVGFVAWLMILQWLVIKHFCIYCLSAHVFGVIAFIVILMKAPIWKRYRYAALKISGTATAALAFLIAVHIFVVPDLLVVQAAADVETVAEGSDKQTFSGGSIKIGRKPESRTVSLLNNNLNFDLYKVPLEGRPEADYVILDLSDYCCPECRKVHGRLKTFKEKYKVDLAVVVLPVPMNPECNPDLQNLHPAFKNSCTYIRYAMAVAAAAPEKFSAYHDYLMDGGRPPDVADARKKAEALIGAEAFANGLTHPSVDQWINDGLNIYRFIEGQSIPKLIIKDHILSAGSGSKYAFFEKMKELLELPNEQ